MHRKRNLKHRMDSGCDHYDDDDVDLFCALRVTTTAVGSMTPKMPTQVGHPDIFLFSESDQIVKIVTENNAVRILISPMPDHRRIPTAPKDAKACRRPSRHFLVQ